ncbi:hypothetical protein [Schlesneria sp. T3-172]|uniref:hypothetical protein n=1 Tax=Schlesneria sphaerica TaxID=3373610 RepID=UPI0037CAEF22
MGRLRAASTLRRSRFYIDSCFIIVVFFLVPATGRATPPTLDAAIQALVEWRSSFDSLHMHYEMEQSNRAEPDHGQLTTSGEYYWTQYDRFLWREESFQNGRPSGRRKYFCDGALAGWVWPQGTVMAVPIPPGQRRGVYNAVVTPLAALWNCTELDWFTVPVPPCDIEHQVVDCEGAECLEISFRLPQSAVCNRMVLDPRYSYQPRIYEAGQRYEVTHFKLFEPGIWMPEQGTYDFGDGNAMQSRWRVDRLVFNEDIEDEKVTMPSHAVGAGIAAMESGSGRFHGKRTDNRGGEASAAGGQGLNRAESPLAQLKRFDWLIYSLPFTTAGGIIVVQGMKLHFK